jgi:hypothetical protein
MATNMTGMRVEGTTVVGTGAKRSRGRMPRIGAVGLVAATLALLLVGSVALHNRSTSPSAIPAIPRAVTMQRARFLENNTTNLPNAIAAESAPVVVTSSHQRFLEANTTTLPGAVAVSMTAPITTRAQQRFLEVNTMMPSAGLSSPDAENVPTMGGHPR